MTRPPEIGRQATSRKCAVCGRRGVGGWTLGFRPYPRDKEAVHVHPGKCAQEAIRNATRGLEPALVDRAQAWWSSNAGWMGSAAFTAAQMAAHFATEERKRCGPEVVCLCGSTRFMDAFTLHYGRLTDEGKIVLSVGRVVPQSEQALGSARKVMLDELHKRKIDLADRVFVLNVGGYIGDSTRSEIEYAVAHGKPVDYLESVLVRS